MEKWRFSYICYRPFSSATASCSGDGVVVEVFSLSFFVIVVGFCIFTLPLPRFLSLSLQHHVLHESRSNPLISFQVSLSLSLYNAIAMNRTYDESQAFLAATMGIIPSTPRRSTTRPQDMAEYMITTFYGSVVLFNIKDHEVDDYLQLVRRHASGLLPEMRKHDYAVKEKPPMVNDMEGATDYIVLKTLDIDGVYIIGSMLGQSIALDYFVSQVDGMVEEFADINCAMKKTRTFTMHKKKLLQLVGKVNSNLADVILKVGHFERYAKYAQMYEYLREEYEHNIHFLQEALQNRKSDLLEWCIIGMLSIENVI
ncbi:hypothetical protein UlMin_033692 [Ulmus minor]